jgi:predicted alpha/beta hydrolase
MSDEYQQEYLDRGGDRLGLHVYPSADGAAVVVVWPAMGTPARFYRRFAAKLGEAGLAVVVVDLRGTGSSTPVASRASRYGYADLAGDVGAVLDHLKARLDGRRPYLLGHSLGGQACTLHLGLTGDTDVAGLILVAVGLPYFRAYPGARKWGVLGFTQSISATSAALGVWPGWGFGGRQAHGVIRDWGYTARQGRFPRLDGVDAEAALATVRTPVLAISVERDQFTPAGTLDHLCAKLPAAPIERVHLAGELDHFSWARASDPVVARVAAFVR